MTDVDVSGGESWPWLRGEFGKWFKRLEADREIWLVLYLLRFRAAQRNNSDAIFQNFWNKPAVSNQYPLRPAIAVWTYGKKSITQGVGNRVINWLHVNRGRILKIRSYTLLFACHAFARQQSSQFQKRVASQFVDFKPIDFSAHLCVSCENFRSESIYVASIARLLSRSFLFFRKRVH